MEGRHTLFNRPTYIVILMKSDDRKESLRGTRVYCSTCGDMDLVYALSGNIRKVKTIISKNLAFMKVGQLFPPCILGLLSSFESNF